MELLFERFLSEERGEWPDIDLDLPSGDQRERAIQYVYERYGKLGAAMTANVITYRGRSAAREIGKALSFDIETINRLTKLVGAWEYKDANDTLAHQFRDAGFDLEHPQIRKFFDLCLEVEDLPRHLGQHSGGLVGNGSDRKPRADVLCAAPYAKMFLRYCRAGSDYSPWPHRWTNGESLFETPPGARTGGLSTSFS